MRTYVKLTEDSVVIHLLAALKQASCAVGGLEGLTPASLVERCGELTRDDGRALFVGKREDPDDAVELAFTAVLSLIATLVGDEQAKVASALGVRLAVPRGDGVDVELQIERFVQLLNTLPAQSLAKRAVVEELLTFAIDTKKARSLNLSIEMVDGWVEAWQVDDATKSFIFHLAAQCFEQCGKPLEAQKMRIKILRLPAKKGKVNIQQIAAEVILTAISHPDIFLVDTIISIPHVVALKGDSTYGPLYEILTIMAMGSAEDFRRFASVNSSKLEKLGIGPEEDMIVMSKMRSLTLCSLAAVHPEFPASQVKSKLSVESVEAVESCVVDAVSAGLIEAQIDSENETIAITRATARNITREVWQEVGSRLAAWRDSINHILSVREQAVA